MVSPGVLMQAPKTPAKNPDSTREAAFAVWGYRSSSLPPSIDRSMDAVCFSKKLIDAKYPTLQAAMM